MPLNRACIGKRYPATTTVVTREAVEAYARACNEINPCYFEPAGARRPVAPPLFAVVVTWIPLLAAVTDPDLDADLLRLLHTAQDMHLRVPIRAGDAIVAEAEITAIDSQPTGEALTIALNASNQHGEVVTQILFNALIRGRRGRFERPPSETRQLSPPMAQVTETIDRDQTARYAEAAGDRNPIHIDETVAKMAGLNGIIVHGLCTMAFAARAVIDQACDADPTRLRRLAARFSRPVFPGESITTSIWPGDSRHNLQIFSFLTANRQNQAVIRDGLAEVSAEPV
jgi:acyl dehydratase